MRHATLVAVTTMLLMGSTCMPDLPSNTLPPADGGNNSFAGSAPANSGAGQDSAGSGQDAATTGPDAPGGAGGMSADQLAGCGIRTVTNIPRNVWVRKTTIDEEAHVEPADSPLAKVLYPDLICPENDDEPNVPSSSGYLYQADASGRIVSSCTLVDMTPFGGPKQAVCSDATIAGYLFRIEDGCLEYLPSATRGDALAILGFDPLEVIGLVGSNQPQPSCSLAQSELRLGQSGNLVLLDDNEPYVCLRIDVEELCRHCESRDGMWIDTVRQRTTITALGSLDAVVSDLYAELCHNTEFTVNVRGGDQVVLERTYTEVWEVSPSPQELGFDVQAPLP